MKSFRKLEMIKQDFEEQRAKDKIFNVTSDKTGGLVIKRMKVFISKKILSFIKAMYLRLFHIYRMYFICRNLIREKVAISLNLQKCLLQKEINLRLKVKRKTELGMNSKSNNKPLTRLTKMRRKSISSSSESFSYKEDSNVKANDKIKEGRIPTLSTNQMTMSTQGFLNIPVINMEKCVIHDPFLIYD
ncbi:unnamed protein product [Moneuplotes crassus]|uniref:Uncharacterized protein n=1 Tax=Euplotes crassus TaxID=5936 RepID=A0AAD1U9M7_EUPCR|nr:unnamed protein product [Moneuplotes crassus]